MARINNSIPRNNVRFLDQVSIASFEVPTSSGGGNGESGLSGLMGPGGGQSGLSGLSGISGLSGTGGESGIGGTSGISGLSGTGLSGLSGLSGASTSGLSGLSGISGLSGESGISGLLGISGLSGIGISGLQGISGLSGADGSGIFIQSASSDVYYTTASLQITGSTLLPAGLTPVTTTASQAANNYAVVVSESGWFYNVNAGVPTSNAWGSGLTGSYFNNFTSNTDVSEILRFIAGLLSASAPDASPNTRTYSTTLTETQANNGTGTAPAGYVPQSFTNTDIAYLNSKGFAPTGSTVFAGKTIYNNSAFSSNYSSLAAGSTTVSSSANAQLFGLGVLTSGGPTQFNVSGTVNFFYSDNNLETSTATSQSNSLLSQSTFGTANGLTLAKINTSNPAVIPAAYQDGLFANIFSSNLYNGGLSFTSVSSSGWYHISASVQIQSGSSAYSAPALDTTRIFYSPLSSLTVPNNTLTATNFGNVALTATSRSLSGTPYLQTATWAISSSATGLFNPLYANSSTIADLNESDALVTLAGTTAASTNGGTVQTTNAIYDSTGTTARTVGTIPFETDIVKLTGSATFDAGSAGAENINQTGLGTTTYNLLTRGVNKNGTQSTLTTQTINYFTAGTFGQPAASSSMAYYGRAQGYDGGTLTGGSETFTGETYRIQITNPLLSGSYTSGSKFTTGSYDVYNLGSLDLQVKPGFLVKPGGTYAYWLTDPNPSQTYKYYARAFQTNGSAFSAMTLNVGQTLIPWTGSGAGVSAAIMLQSAGPGVNVGFGALTNPIIFDPSALLNLNIATGQANDNFLNPFTSTIDIKGNNQGGSSLVGTTYTIPMVDSLNQVLNSTYRNLIVIIRYNSDATPVASINVTFS